MVKQKPKGVVIKDFSRLDQVLEFFPARNLRSDYSILQSGDKKGSYQTLDRHEVVGVLQGICWAIIDNEVYKLNKGQMIYIPKGMRSSIYNKNKIVAKIISIKSKIKTD